MFCLHENKIIKLVGSIAVEGQSSDNPTTKIICREWYNLKR